MCPGVERAQPGTGARSTSPDVKTAAASPKGVPLARSSASCSVLAISQVTLENRDRGVSGDAYQFSAGCIGAACPSCRAHASRFEARAFAQSTERGGGRHRTHARTCRRMCMCHRACHLSHPRATRFPYMPAHCPLHLLHPSAPPPLRLLLSTCPSTHPSDRTMALPESLDAHHWAEDLLAQDCCRGRALVEHHRPQKEAFAERTPGQNPEHAATKSECAREQGAGQHASASAAKLRPLLAFRPQSCT